MSIKKFTSKEEVKEEKQTDEKNFAIWQTIEDISKAINKLSTIKTEIETLNNNLSRSKEDIRATLDKFTKENTNINKEYYILQEFKSLILFLILLVLTFILRTKVNSTVIFTIVYILEATGIVLTGYNLLNLLKK
jgi:hypothetical protein